MEVLIQELYILPLKDLLGLQGGIWIIEKGSKMILLMHAL